LLEDLYPAGNEMPPEMRELQPLFQECRDVFLDGIDASVPTHGDVYRGNLFQTRDRLYLIDWEHSGMNDPVYDLADFTIQAEFTDAESDEFFATHGALSNRLICRQRFFHARQLSRLVWRLWALARSKAT
jgi:thiamine kinase-like enzyme